MSERHTDPLELWVGTWTPEEWIARETRRREETVSPMSAAEPAEREKEKPAE